MYHYAHVKPKLYIHSTPPIMKKNMQRFCFISRWLFIKGDVFIGVCGIFGADIFLHYSQFFVKGNFVIGGVECISYATSP